MRLYGMTMSGNCWKVSQILRLTDNAYDWIETDPNRGDAATPEFRALNPQGEVPVLQMDDGTVLTQSNAILTHFAEATPWMPAPGLGRTRVLQWLFWEQYSHEPYIAVARFQRLLLGRPADQIERRLMERGHAALARMALQLDQTPFLVGAALSLADVALVAYTRTAHEGGFDLSAYPSVGAWVARVEAALGIAP